MALKPAWVQRREVLLKALVAVETAARDTGKIAVMALAGQLLAAYPDSEMKLPYLKDQIVRFAEERGVRVNGD